MSAPSFEAALAQARSTLRSPTPAAAKPLYARLLQQRPAHVESAIVCARLHLADRETAAAHGVLRQALAHHPGHEMLAVELGTALAAAGDFGAALDVLRAQVDRVPDSPMAWLLMSQILADRGQPQASALAAFQALDRAQRLQVWQSPDATPPAVVPWVRRARGAVRNHRRAVFQDALRTIADAHPPAAMARVAHAVAVYLGEQRDEPPHAEQRPRVFFFPGLPVAPFLDPMLQPWAPRLAAAFGDLREEALSLLPQRTGLEDFVQVGPGDRMQNYLGGEAPAWEAFFFYRHGQRYDDNHRRCPRTSAVLESLDLVRIPGQTPEVCFSVLAPGTQIRPHHGVTNTRLVMHLPLQVPRDCALRLVGHGEHVWKEGELVMFDDTYLHEAWNRSDRTRVILLMDCWHPALTPVEREAVSRIAQVIGTLDFALAAGAWDEGP